MQLVKLWDKYDRELFFDLHLIRQVKKNTIKEEIVLWLQRVKLKKLSRLF
ncbi:MAG: hypothetical protein BWY21_01621 [Parcubacteria group bacterium ADurb.Bin216]|jgi:hypothetical protein|nr:MAG: hypothetical protein BWY21_01621 [Parcubacteria group bacterium ADurb.Bin216]